MEKKNVYWFSQSGVKEDRRKTSVRVQSEFSLDDWDWDYDQVENTPSNSIIEINEDDVDIMIVRPNLDDVLVDSVYKYVHTVCGKNEKQDYLIPLWHHELVYEDGPERDFIVRIIPKLPSENYWIDGENNLHQKVEYTLYELWDCVMDDKYMEIYFGKKRLIFYPKRLRLQEEQTWVWEEQGISSLNEQNVYDVSKRSDMILHIYISGIM